MWLWGYAEIDNPDEVRHGLDIRSFVYAMMRVSRKVYFHNLKHDGHFIIDYLLKSGYKLIVDNSQLAAKQFSTLISDMGKFYSMKVRWANGTTTEFRDSVKKLPMKLSRVASSFKLAMKKGELDYDAYRPVGHMPTPEELDYLHNDVSILAHAMRIVYEQGMKALTLGADALAEYKSLVGSKMFAETFPVLPEAVDTDIRRAYRGGFTYADPRFMGRVIENQGIVFDVNSLYPYVMRTRLIPYGEPVFMRGLPKTNDRYPLSIFTVTFTAKLKKDHIPCIQIKNSFRFAATEYLRVVDEPTTISVTNVDWDLYNDHYDIVVHEYGGGYIFKAQTGFFNRYIDKWSKVKEKAVGGEREIAKLFLNNLYGKFATNPNVTGKFPELKEDGSVKFVTGQPETRPPVYTAAGVFITAHARDITIRAAQQNYDTFAYADTDSLHLFRPDVPESLNVHPTELGAWKMEYTLGAAFYGRAKVYLERHDGRCREMHDCNHQDGDYTNAIAGYPTDHSSKLTFDDLVQGVVLPGKLVPKSVPGGVVLKEVGFKLEW